MKSNIMNNKFFVLFLAFVIVGTISFLAIQNAASGTGKIDTSNINLAK